MSDCNCYVARHPKAAEIDAALVRGDDPRDVAARYKVGKTKVYDHRRHLREGSSSAAPDATDHQDDASTATIEAPPAPHGRRLQTAERSAENRRRPAERVERRTESRGTSRAVPPTSSPGPARALPGSATDAIAVPVNGYLQAIDACLELVTSRRWRPNHIRGIAERFGISVDRSRHAYHEAMRHLQLDMGGYVQKQATSAAWCMGQRDDARARADAATVNAERWRRQEREAQEAADKLQGKERFAQLETAARFGLLATKYDLSAEKWSAQALAHQRHLDDVLGLRAPKEAHFTQNNFGADSSALLERFADLLARRFADRPEIISAIEEASSAIEAGADEAPLDEEEAA